MSHDIGEIYSLDAEVIGWFEYNGTCDVAYSRIYNAKEDLVANWRGKDNQRFCKCEVQPELVILYTDYAEGFYWLGKVCMGCKAIIAGFYPASIDGKPFQIEETKNV